MPGPSLPRCVPFTIRFDEVDIARIRQRVADYRWAEMPDDGGWVYGTNLLYLKDLCNYWVQNFQWHEQERTLNRHCHFITEVQGIDIHFIFEKGSGARAKPLLLLHGWPGSIAEFKDIIEPLAHPECFGGHEAVAFDVIAPSLPGFGFSGRPSRPIGPRRMADIFNQMGPLRERLQSR